MKFFLLEEDGEIECGMVFAFAPSHPINQEDREKYAQAQRKWLELWEPLAGDWIQ